MLCWGLKHGIHKDKGQGGAKGQNFSDLHYKVPTKIKGGPSSVKAVSAWSEFCMALKEDGTVYTWGANSRGQAGQPA